MELKKTWFYLNYDLWWCLVSEHRQTEVDYLCVDLPRSPRSINKSNLLSQLYALLPLQLLCGFRGNIFEIYDGVRDYNKNTEIPRNYRSIFALVSSCCDIRRNLYRSGPSLAAKWQNFLSAEVFGTGSLRGYFAASTVVVSPSPPYPPIGYSITKDYDCYKSTNHCLLASWEYKASLSSCRT